VTGSVDKEVVPDSCSKIGRTEALGVVKCKQHISLARFAINVSVPKNSLSDLLFYSPQLPFIPEGFLVTFLLITVADLVTTHKTGTEGANNEGMKFCFSAIHLPS
jgi:hypothetical protein